MIVCFCCATTLLRMAFEGGVGSVIYRGALDDILSLPLYMTEGVSLYHRLEMLAWI